MDDPAAHGYSSEVWSAVDKITRCPRSWWQLVSVYRTLPAGYDSKTLSSVAGLTGAEVSAIESANERHTAGPGTLQLFSDLNIHIATIYTYTLVYFNGEDGPPSIQNKNGTFFDPARTLRVFDAALLNDMRLSKGQTTSVAGGQQRGGSHTRPQSTPGRRGTSRRFCGRRGRLQWHGRRRRPLCTLKTPFLLSGGLQPATRRRDHGSWSAGDPEGQPGRTSRGCCPAARRSEKVRSGGHC